MPGALPRSPLGRRLRASCATGKSCNRCSETISGPFRHLFAPLRLCFGGQRSPLCSHKPHLPSEERVLLSVNAPGWDVSSVRGESLRPSAFTCCSAYCTSLEGARPIPHSQMKMCLAKVRPVWDGGAVPPGQETEEGQRFRNQRPVPDPPPGLKMHQPGRRLQPCDSRVPRDLSGVLQGARPISTARGANVALTIHPEMANGKLEP